MAATYKDIQRRTGLSLATISKYFNGGKVREDNRKAIQAAIEALDFHVNAYARSLKSRKSMLVGGLIPELNSTFNTQLMSEVEDALRQQGYGFMVCDCHLDKERERESLEFLLDRMVDGIITIPFDKSGHHLELAKERNVPVVLIDRLTTAFETDAVIVDNAAASAEAAEELIGKGHRDIAIIDGPDSLYTMQERMNGFQDTLKKHDIRIHRDWMIHAPMTVDGGYEAAKSIFVEEVHPSALFCANYEVTLGTVMALNEMGIRVPEDVSLIGFDNLMLSGVIKPKLTMLMQPMQELGHKAAELLISRMEGTAPQEGPTVTSLKAELIAGQSVKIL